MFINLYIQTENTAFDDKPASEIARILRAYADQLERTGEPSALLRDINGNTVGEAYSHRKAAPVPRGKTSRSLLIHKP